MMKERNPDTSGRRHILVLDTGNEWGGGTNSLLELLRRLDKQRFRLTCVFYKNYPKGSSSDVAAELRKAGAEFVLMPSRRHWARNLFKEAARPFLSFSKELREKYFFEVDLMFRVRPNAARLVRLMRGLDIDLLYMNNQIGTDLEGIIAAKSSGVRALLHSRINTRINRFQADAANKYLDRIICVSGGVKSELERQGVDGSRMVVVYNGIDTGTSPARPRDEVREELGIPEGSVLVGSVGSLMSRKRFSDLVDAVGLLKAGGRMVNCIIAGDGPEMDPLNRRIRDAGLERHVRLIGFQTDPLSYINALDVFILPSEKEGFPRVILEAMLMGVPVIATDTTGPPEQVLHGETGFIYGRGDVQALAGYLDRVAGSSELRTVMGGRGRRHVIENFAMDRYVNGVSAVIEEVLGL